MGEISKMMLEGILCCQCGAALEDRVIDQEIGVPIICEDCFNCLDAKGRKEFQYRCEKDFK